MKSQFKDMLRKKIQVEFPDCYTEDWSAYYYFDEVNDDWVTLRTHDYKGFVYYYKRPISECFAVIVSMPDPYPSITIPLIDALNWIEEIKDE